jgi:hypothetical protein
MYSAMVMILVLKGSVLEDKNVLGKKHVQN